MKSFEIILEVNGALDKYTESEKEALIKKKNDIYNALPEDLKGVIKDTVTVSGHGSTDTDNFTSTDKLYLLAPKEIYADWSDQYDTAKDKTRQLDYYKNIGVTTDKYDRAIKKTSSHASAIKNNSAGSASWWWLRSANSFSSNYFYIVGNGGGWGATNADRTNGVSPAFRIG